MSRVPREPSARQAASNIVVFPFFGRRRADAKSADERFVDALIDWMDETSSHLIQKYYDRDLCLGDRRTLESAVLAVIDHRKGKRPDTAEAFRSLVWGADFLRRVREGLRAKEAANV